MYKLQSTCWIETGSIQPCPYPYRALYARLGSTSMLPVMVDALLLSLYYPAYPSVMIPPGLH